MEQLLSKVIKRRKRPTYVPKKEEAKKEESSSSSSSSEDEKEKEKPEWVYMTDPYGRPCWQHRKTGQVTYGNSYQPAGYNAQMAQEAFAGDDSDSDDDKKKKPAAYAARAAAPPPVAPIAVMQQPPAYGPPGMPYMQSPVHPQYYGQSPVPYGMSPVAVYSTAPWNAMPASPVAVQVPEYIKKQHAEAEKARKKKEEAEKKRIAAGVWERFYTDDGGMYWQHSVTGKKVSRDPYY
ncbi:unnamed protein product [Scytosiphon promiscuus]